MPMLGDALSSGEHPPRQLARHARRAEEGHRVGPHARLVDDRIEALRVHP